MTILPRQARDKHRERHSKRTRFCRLRGLEQGANRLQVTALGSAGAAQAQWKETLALAAGAAQRQGPLAIKRSFADG